MVQFELKIEKVIIMAIAEENTRVQVTMPKALKAKIDELAKEDNRRFSNYVVTVLQKHVNNLNDDKK